MPALPGGIIGNRVHIPNDPVTVFGVIGPNGSGKSSLLNGMLRVLYYPGRTGQEDSL